MMVIDLSHNTVPSEIVEGDGSGCIEDWVSGDEICHSLDSQVDSAVRYAVFELRVDRIFSFLLEIGFV